MDKKQKLRFLVFLIFCGIYGNLQAQDTILFLNGKTMEANVASVTEEQVMYQVKKKGKTFERTIDRYRVFSIQYKDGREEVLYEQDTAIGNHFTEHEMRMFVYGSQDAQRGYKAPLATALGLAYGMAGGAYLHESFFVFVVPFSFTLIAGIPKVKIKEKSIRDRKYMGEPAYIVGYERVAKSKKILNALKGSIAGTVIGVTTLLVLKKQGVIGTD